LNDVYLIKTDANGDSLWTKTFGGTDNDFGLSIQQTTDGGYILVGETYSFGAGNDDVYLIKTDANGDSLWTKAFGGIGNDFGNSIEQTTDGGYIIGASTYSFGAGNVDVYLIKTDANGDSLWTKTFGGTAYDGLRSVQQTIDGGYIIAGYTNSFGAGIYLIKTDANGNSGCNQGNTATIITITTTQVTTTTTIVSSGGIVTIPATIVGSGGILNTLCTTVGINEITSAYSLSIYPNPTTNNFIIKLNSETKNTHLEIFNTLGEKVHSETINRQSTAINLKYPAGIYFVKVGDGEKVYVQKLIIQ
jgi:hypothetical protein